MHVYDEQSFINISSFLFSSSGKRFYAHRICLLASSDAFRAMFDGGYRVSLSFACIMFGLSIITSLCYRIIDVHIFLQL